ncbi:MAG: glycosyltransferase family 4 protein [Candidatus Polarisedimenticolia bacterium]
MRPLRIALVAAGPESVPGGQSVQARLLLDRLRARGHEVSLLPINPTFPRGLRWARRIPLARTVLNQALYLPSLLRLRGCDVAHVFSASYGSFFLAPVPAIAAARLFGRRVILNYHSGEADDHMRRDGRWVAPWLRRCDALVVPSVYLQEIFARHGHVASVIPNVVDLSRFPFRERGPSRQRLLCTRNLEPIYAVDVVVRAFALLARDRPGVTLTLAGTGSQETSLRDLAHRLGVRPHFTGRVEPDAMPRVYEQADLFLNASVVDNQPLSILEAFAAGLPVATTGTGDISSLVSHEETGLLVRSEDPRALAAAAARLMDDSSLAARLARGARARVERHDWSRIAPLWESVLAGPPEGGPGRAAAQAARKSA